MNYYALSDIGSFREKNQDAYYVGTNTDGDFLALVLDGVGGSKAGEVASNKAVEYIRDNFENSGSLINLKETKDYVDHLITKTNEYIFNLSLSNNNYYGMGTTLTGIYISKFGAFSINVGDSRVYGIKENKIELLTDDDTLINQMLKSGDISKEEAYNHPDRHCIVKAIGMAKKVEPTLSDVDKYDYYLVCSDGLHGYVDEDKILEVISEDTSLKQKCDELLSLSLLAGGYDNITVVLVSWQK